MIDIDKLTRFQIPSARQTLTPTAIALYALSIGMGREAADKCQLRFTDPLQGPEVMPSMVLVMAHPGFWMADPASGVDPKAVLHAAQSFEILAPLPKTGAVESRSRVNDVIDKGAGKAALILTETELRNAEGTPFARLTRTTFIRGGGGFGGASRAKTPRPETPQCAPDRVIDLTTGPDQALYYRLNGDLNPMHSDPEVAAKAGFESPILHGLCTMGIVTHALLKGLAEGRPERLRKVSLNFSKPVFPGDTIRTELWNDGRFRARVPERDVTVIDGGRAETADTPSLAVGG